MKIRKAEIKDIARIGYLLHQVNDVHADGRPDLFIHGKRKYNDDELVEITPDNIRLRKKYLTSIERRQAYRDAKALEE